MKQRIFINKVQYVMVSESDFEDVLGNEYCSFNTDYDNLDWFVNDVIVLENEMVFCFQNTKKDIILTDEAQEVLLKKIIVAFLKKTQ